MPDHVCLSQRRDCKSRLTRSRVALQSDRVSRKIPVQRSQMFFLNTESMFFLIFMIHNYGSPVISFADETSSWSMQDFNFTVFFEPSQIMI